MMKVHVIGSSSAWNTIICDNGNSVFILDAGCDFNNRVKPAVNYDIARIAFVLTTHAHKDHCRHAKDYLKAGITVYMPTDLKDRYKDSYCAVELEPAKKHRHGDYSITPIVVPHGGDVICYAYIIEHEAFGKLLYMVDCMYCPFDLSKLHINHFFVECNHGEVDRNAPNFEHSVSGHMSVDTCRDFLRHNMTDDARSVLLCHMSDTLTDADSVIEKIKEVLCDGCTCRIAEKGLQIEIGKETEVPF